MIHFVIATGPANTATALAPILGPAVERTRVFDGVLTEWAGERGTWAAACISRPDPVLAQRIARSAEGLAIIGGAPLARHGGQASLADRLLASYQASGPKAVEDHLAGAFNVVLVDDAHGLAALRDVCGAYPLYVHEGTDAVVFSNRSSTVAAVGCSTGREVRALGWVIGRDNLFGPELPQEGVHLVPTGLDAAVAPGTARMALTRSPEWIWPDPDSEGRVSLTSTEWDDITDDLVAAARLIDQVEGPVNLALTGGRDSRLTLALASAAGLNDKVSVFTKGGPYQPEMALARQVADTAKFNHVGPDGYNPPPAVTCDAAAVNRLATPRGESPEWGRLRRQAFRYEGIVGAFNDRSGWAKPEEVVIEGFLGELYSGRHEPQFHAPHPISVAAYRDMFADFHLPFGRHDVMRPEEHARQVTWFHEWVDAHLAEVRLDVLPERCYLDARIGHWVGPMVQSAPFVTLFPLVSSHAARTVLSLHRQHRTGDQLHLEVIRRTAPDLVDIPLFDDSWGPRSTAPWPPPTAALPDRTGRGRVAPPTARPNSKQDFRALTKRRSVWAFLADQTSQIEALLDRAGTEANLGSICDMDEVLALGRRSAELESGAEVRRLLACIGAAHCVLGIEDPIVAGPLPRPMSP